MLVSLKGETWKAMSTITTPVFTSGRLKGMLPIMHRISVQLKEVTGEMVKEKQLVQLKPLFSDLAFEVIMSTGFGIEINAWKDKDNIAKNTLAIFLAMLSLSFQALISIPKPVDMMTSNARSENRGFSCTSCFSFTISPVTSFN
jgi:cytochrome P450